MWKRINTRTCYSVNFETEQLIEKAVKALDDNMKVTEIRIVVERGGLDDMLDKEVLEADAAMGAGNVRTIRVKEAVGDTVRYDLIGDLVANTGLTRKTIVAILKGIGKETFDCFKTNPEEFISKACR